MKPADLRDRHDATSARRGGRTRDRRVLVERQVRSGPFVVSAIQIHQPLESGGAEDDDVIETLASRGSDEPLGICVGVSPALHPVMQVTIVLKRNLFTNSRTGPRTSRHATSV